ncbi:MAG: iron-sulfur cluster repair di-iron protein [Calditrichaeota bacterium]|nr:iron-sulfur cluster repair di-iron protein [Calditrichota bacterium]MCB9367483.1 iron-sulfur cluster repair di-iron protein [Calditrichota bacterium]
MENLLETPVGQLVVDKPSRARIFQKHKIDFCCGGGRPLNVVCEEKNIDPQTIKAELADQDSREDTNSEPDWSKATLSALVDNILAQHHDYLKNALPHLGEMAEKVYRVHGEHHPEMLDVLQTFSGLYAELDSHMYKEENILFPAVKRIEQGSLPAEAAAQLFGPISVMEQEHESAGQALLKLRELTNDYTPPADACNTFRGLFAGLEELERDLHWHIHKENNILFPRALRGK